MGFRPLFRFGFGSMVLSFFPQGFWEPAARGHLEGMGASNAPHNSHSQSIIQSIILRRVNNLLCERIYFVQQREDGV